MKHFKKNASQARFVSELGNGILKSPWQSLRGLPVCTNEQAGVQPDCFWIIACCIFHKSVNSGRRDTDIMESFDDTDDAEMGRNESDATRIRTIRMSEAAWRREIEKQIIDFCGFI